MNMKTSEVLDLAADKIQERGWVQGNVGHRSVGGAGPLCLEGCIAEALGLPEWGTVAHGAVTRLESAPAQAVRSYLDLPNEWDALWPWNDDLGRTENEVIEVLRAAAAVERTKEVYETEDQPLPVHIPAGVA